MMNTISIVVDSEVLSKWKFDFISRLCEKVQVREFIILGNKDKKTLKSIFFTTEILFGCQTFLSLRTTKTPYTL